MAMNPDERGNLFEAAEKLQRLQQKYLRLYQPLKASFEAEKSIQQSKMPRGPFLMMANKLGSLLPEDGQFEIKLSDAPRVPVLFPPLPSPPPSPSSPTSSTSSARSTPPASPVRSPAAYSLSKDILQ